MTEKPDIRILGPGDEAALEAFVLPQIETSMFLLGNMRAAGLSDTGQPYSGAYAAAVDRGEILAVVAHYWNGNIVTQATVHLHPLWQAAVAASGRPIEGLIGPHDQVQAVKEALGLTHVQAQLDETEGLYRLGLEALQVPDGLYSGKLRGRRIEPHDVELVTGWMVTYNREALGEAEGTGAWEQARASVERLMAKGHTWILEDSGQPVATSSFNTAIAEAVQVGGVWTPHELRCRGYGRAAVAASLLDARDEGVQTAILFTGQRNVAARRAYAALGFRQIGQYRLLLLRSPISADPPSASDR